MIHAREDYNGRIIDTDNLIPEDEPVFLIRGQDKYAPQIILNYAAIVANDNPEIAQLCVVHAARIFQWQAENGMKIPDLPYQRQQTDRKEYPSSVVMSNVDDIKKEINKVVDAAIEVDAEVDAEVKDNKPVQIYQPR